MGPGLGPDTVTLRGSRGERSLSAGGIPDQPQGYPTAEGAEKGVQPAARRRWLDRTGC